MLSFIVPAHNEQDLLPSTLESIHESAKAIDQPYEIIVANDASTDATAQIAEQHGARVVHVDHRQISKTRNSGAAEAQGDVFIFVDADTTISQELVRAVLTKIQAGAVGGGAAVKVEGRLPWYARIITPIFVFCYLNAGLAAGCFVYCTREAFDAVGGFNEELYATEEVSFSWAMRRHGKFVILREPVTTSGRKLRTYSLWEMTCMLSTFAFRGMPAVKSRDKLGLWYDPRREDTDQA